MNLRIAGLEYHQSLKRIVNQPALIRKIYGINSRKLRICELNIIKDVSTQTNAHDQLFLQQYGNNEVVTFNHSDSVVFQDEIIDDNPSTMIHRSGHCGK